MPSGGEHAGLVKPTYQHPIFDRYVASREFYATLQDAVWSTDIYHGHRRTHKLGVVKNILNYSRRVPTGDLLVAELMYHHLLADDAADGEDGALKGFEKEIRLQLDNSQEFPDGLRRTAKALLKYYIPGLIIDAARGIDYLQKEEKKGNDIIHMLGESQSNIDKGVLAEHLWAGYEHTKNFNIGRGIERYQAIVDKMSGFDMNYLRNLDGMVNIFKEYYLPDLEKLTKPQKIMVAINNPPASIGMIKILSNKKRMDAINHIIEDCIEKYSAIFHIVTMHISEKIMRRRNNDGFYLLQDKDIRLLEERLRSV